MLGDIAFHSNTTSQREWRNQINPPTGATSVLVALTIQVLIQLGTIFEAGSDFGQIGPAVSAAV
eukprot:6005781-Prymnesium_polylepis.1